MTFVCFVSIVHITGDFCVARVHCSYNVGVLLFIVRLSFVCRVSAIRVTLILSIVHIMFLCCAFVIRVTFVCRLSHVTFVCCASTVR